jgi:hypothetical protein
MQKEIKTNWLDVAKAKIDLLGNYKWHLVKYSLYVISAIYTILLFRSQAYTLFSKNLQSVCGAVIEIAKYELPVIALVGVIGTKKVHWGLRVLALALALPCFYYSIKATAGFQLLAYNEVKDRGFEVTEDYQRLTSELNDKRAQRKTVMDNQSKSIDLDKTTNAKNNDLANQLHNDTKAYQKKINVKNTELQQAINRNSKKPCPSTISRLKSELKQLENSLNDTFAQLQGIKQSDAIAINSKTIETLNNDIKELNNQIDNLKKNYKADGGYRILFATQKEFNDFINNLALLIELVGIFAAIMVGQQNKSKKIRKITTVYYEDDGNGQNYNNQTSAPSHSIASNNQSAPVTASSNHNAPVIASSNQNAPVTASSNYNVANRNNNTNVGYHDFEPYDDNEKVNEVQQPQQSKKIGFDIPEVIIDKTPATQTETQYIDFNRDDILEYLEYMYENAEDDICPGERKFADNTELKNKQIRGIRYYLNKIGIIKVLPGKCEILLPYSDALKLI